MSKKITHSLFATAALVLALPTAETAQAASADGPATSDIGSIVVTARRTNEKLQDVPVSVQAISGNQIEKMAITSVEELSKVAPGLTLVNAGSSTAITLRGVTWQPGSGTPATPLYFNEVPFDPGNTVVSIYDVEQVEVLRGPQGTSRGAPSISGAITISTRKPDLVNWGGFVQTQLGAENHWDVQAALNVPIVTDKLAFRFATNVEESEYNRVRSVNSQIAPKYKDQNFRGTLLFKPTDTLSLQAMYQRRTTQIARYNQVAGTGSPGLAALGIPANFNGPALAVADNASVEDLPNTSDEHLDLLTINASWDVLGQKLTYNFGRQFNRNAPNFNAVDQLNIVPGYEAYTAPSIVGLPKWRTHEVRLSSNPSPGRFFDYDIGWFSKHSQATQNFFAPVYLPGAFGAPFQARPGQVIPPNPRYVLNSSTDIGLGQYFDSFYGNVKFHIGEKTELTGGVARVKDRVPVQINITTTQAFIAFANFLPPASGGCPAPGFLPPSPVYGAAYCEVSQAASVFPPEVHNDKYSDTLYHVSLSHKFSDQLLVYVTTGSSFRTGLPAINNTGLPANLTVPNSETAKSYELGVKTSWGRRLTVNADVFQLDYKNQLTTFEGVSYFNAITNRVAQTSLAFYRNIDARVRGFEMEIAAAPIDNLSLVANLSYAQIKSKGGSVPCNNPTGPALSVANPINTCASPAGQVLNTSAPFQGTINGSYNLPLGNTYDGYFRFNLAYQGNNPNFGNYKQGSTFRSTPSYAVLDLYAGLTGNDGAWDFGVYAKNVANKQVELSRVLTLNTVYPLFAAPGGYDVVRVSPPREIGVRLRYAFGSR